MVSACAGKGPEINQSREAAVYAARARSNYRTPGPASDPWRPYILEASKRFDVPERWIREVMRVESGGNLYQNGRPITSWAGAMGLMQVMPGTYDDLRGRYYDLGGDPFDPHDNIMAGAAYMREMYDVYGAPGFLAAYNAGPKRLDAYLSNTRPLPDETRRYVAMIGPYIMDSHPANRSPAEDYAMNVLPVEIPAGLRYGRATQYASDDTPPVSRRTAARKPVRVAQLPVPPRKSASSRTAVAANTPAPSNRRGFNLITPAVAEPIPMQQGGAMAGGWAVQVGAFGNQSQASAAAGQAKQRAHELGVARPKVASVQQGRALLWRARLTGLSRDAAVDACKKLARSRTNCIVLSPDSQS